MTLPDFTVKDWQNRPSQTTPANADALKDIEKRTTDYAKLVAGWGVGAANAQTANYILALADAQGVVEMNNASARTITVPPNADVAFDVGTIIELARMGAGTLTVVAGAGVTVRAPSGLLTVADQYGTVSLRKRDTNEWVLAGDLG